MISISLNGGKKMASAAAWMGNITIKMDGKEETYSPVGSVTVEKYSEEGAYALKIMGGDGSCSVIMRMGKKDCKEIIKKFTDVL